MARALAPARTFRLRGLVLLDVFETGDEFLVDAHLAAVGVHGELQGRGVGSLMIFREAAIVVAVMSNISQADTPALALKIAEAFAEAPKQNPAR